MWFTCTKTRKKIDGPKHGLGVHVTTLLLRLLVHAILLRSHSNSSDDGVQATLLSQVSVHFIIPQRS